ncbi:hypothetical protein DMC16_15700 [Lacticaseibacillus paracasei]|uniref:DUF4209 domain-containing protein n=1 Tax=Lacticaseibacillus paracasei TaxID=1597 RepID=UPI000D76D794|nr:DUF4209 domain-containing protein [Lacticaseibacillus paracasei]AWR92451.1 hypothetical protein DMC16_15700 [Lacticaseibacillus paracasei]
MKSDSNLSKTVSRLDKIDFSRLFIQFPTEINNDIKDVLNIIFNRCLLGKDNVNLRHSNETIKNAIISNPGLEEHRIKILKDIIEKSNNDGLIAQIGLVLWSINKDYEAAEKSISSNENLLNSLDYSKQSSELLFMKYVTAIYVLKLQLNQQAIEFLENRVIDSLEINKEFYANNLIDYIIVENDYSNMSDSTTQKVDDYLDKLIHADGSADFAGELIVKIAQKRKDLKKEKEAYIRMAEAHENFSKYPGIHELAKIKQLNEAARLYKEGNDEKGSNRCSIEEQEETKSLLLSNEGHLFSQNLSLDKPLNYYKHQLEGENLWESISIISDIVSINHDSMQKSYSTMLKKFPFFAMISKSTFDGNGITRKVDGGMSTDESVGLFKQAEMRIVISAKIINILSHEYVLKNMENRDCLNAVKSQLDIMIKQIMPKSVDVISDALLSTLSDDYDKVLEILIVSLETFLAALLQKHGVSTVKHNDDGTEEDKTMGPLIDLCRKKQLLNPNDLFLYEALLCNKNGLNIRNLALHRLQEDNDRNNEIYLFCGYFLIKLFRTYGVEK